MKLDIVSAETLMDSPYDGNIANLLERAVAEHPNTVAIEHAGEAITYRDLGDRVARFADGLQELGLTAGDRVGVYMPNGIDFCTAVWACCHAGITASPLNSEYRRREIEDLLYDHPEIHEAAVFGVPDERRGETVAAAITLVEGAEITADDVKLYVLDELAPYKHPRIVEVRSDLPKTGSGKIRKTKLRDEITDERGLES